MEHFNRIGQIMVDEVVEGLNEPVSENRVVVDEKNRPESCELTGARKRTAQPLSVAGRWAIRNVDSQDDEQGE